MYIRTCQIRTKITQTIINDTNVDYNMIIKRKLLSICFRILTKILDYFRHNIVIDISVEETNGVVNEIDSSGSDSSLTYDIYEGIIAQARLKSRSISPRRCTDRGM